MPEVLDGLPRRMGDWAANRSLAPTSVTGISLALGLCAAAWFSAGTRPDNVRGALALLLSYLAWRGARWLARACGGAAAEKAAGDKGTLAELGGALSDYAVYAGLAVGGYETHWSGTWELAAAVVIAMAVRRTAVACGGHIAAPAADGNPLGSVLRGFLSYSAGGRIAVVVIAAPIWGAHATLLILLEWGIIATAYVVTGHGPERVVVEDAGRPLRAAVGAAVAGSPGLARSSARAELSAHAEPSARTERSRGGGADARAPANTELSARPEFSARVDSPAADPRVMDVSLPADPQVPAEPAARVDSPVPADPDPASLLDSPGLADPPSRADPQASADPGQGLDSAVRAHSQAPVGSAGLSASAALTRLASGGQSETPLALAAPAATTMTLELMIHRETDQRRESRPRTVLEPRALATIAAYRDDGAAAVWLSRVVRGQFVPLPPAVAGLAATSFLAWLGMRNLPGVLLLTPLVVMLLAAFGSGHPHNGRLDWLVPAVLMAGQLVYVAAIGFSFGVWAPLTFTLCALIAMRYIDLTVRDRRDPPARLGRPAETRLGWEGRMLVVGLGAMLGVPVVAYVALSAYLAVLVCGRVRTSVLAGGAAERR